MEYQATFKRGGETWRTAWHETAEKAQNYIGRGIGSFRYLGTINGDVFEMGQCVASPRNGGLVTIETRD
jgi:hypothetical protein